MQAPIETGYDVLARVDDAGRVTEINSSAFVEDASGWTVIDHGFGDRYHHAQSNYLPKPLLTGGGAYRYALVDGAMIKRDADAIAADEAGLRAGNVPPTDAITPAETASALADLTEIALELNDRLMEMELGSDGDEGS